MSISISPESVDSAAPADRATPPVRGGKRGRQLVALGVGALGLLFSLGYFPRHARRAALAEEADRIAREPVSVGVVTPVRAQATRSLLLPGSIQALERASVYSRANGYVRSWRVDMGDHVEAGELLAELDTPELAREMDQAAAALAQADAGILQAEATLAYSRSTLERHSSLASLGLTSQQELEERKAQASVSAANVRVAETERRARAAQLQRLEQLASFARVVAPFTGSVAARSVERGSLVSAGADSPLFEIVAIDPVRVFIQVPQSLVQGVQPGIPAQLELSEFPGVSFAGVLTRSSGTLDAQSRTMKVEVRVPNPDAKLLPGMYASVRLELTSSQRSFLLPATTLLNRKAGTVVAVVDDEDRVRLRPVEIERDSGAEVEIDGGLTGSERVIRAPRPDIAEGQSVRVAS